jgi:hypothetical protein
MTPAKVRLAMAAMGKPETVVSDLCKELGVTARPSTVTLHRTDPSGRTGKSS